VLTLLINYFNQKAKKAAKHLLSCQLIYNTVTYYAESHSQLTFVIRLHCNCFLSFLAINSVISSLLVRFFW